MKRCSYCGKEYAEDMTLCPVDKNPLESPKGSEGENADATAASPDAAGKSKVLVVYPEYQWSARDGWKFLGMMGVFSVLWYLVTSALYKSSSHFAHWRWGPVGVVVMQTIYIGYHLLLAAYFARTESLALFCKAVGLDRRPSSYVWFGVTAALGIRLLGHIVYKLGWAHIYSSRNDLWGSFVRAHGPASYLYLLPLMMAGFWEEPVYRGFAYKAFRGSYSMVASVGIVIGFTAYTHWNQYSHFGWAVIALSALTAVQCYLREKSDSLWDCILCHLVFNGSGLFM